MFSSKLVKFQTIPFSSFEETNQKYNQSVTPEADADAKVRTTALPVYSKSRTNNKKQKKV
jgi:hypothetical protein